MSDSRVSRRELLLGATAVLAGGLSTANPLIAAPNHVKPGRLDLHHHYASPKWMRRLAESNREGAGAFRRGYDPARAIEAMNKGGVATAFLSITTPGVWLGDDFPAEPEEVIALARDMNEYGARVVGDNPGRFGLFATLPLPDIEASLREIEYAFDSLKADGIGLLSSYGNHWLGDQAFQPVLVELNRRKAVVHVHPTDAPCCRNLANVGPGELEWLTDTARSILSMIAGDPSPATLYPDIKLIWSHAGGSLVGVASRIVGGVRDPDYLSHPPAPNSRLYHVRRFYYDTAGSANPMLMQALAQLVGDSQIVYGSDYPFGDPGGTGKQLQTCGFNPRQLHGIESGNALTILPKYKLGNPWS